MDDCGPRISWSTFLINAGNLDFYVKFLNLKILAQKKKKPNPNHKNVKYASIHYRGIPISVSISILGFYSLNRKLDWKI